MATDSEPDDDIARRRIPALLVYLNPFRIVTADGAAEWQTTIEQINRRDWDYVALHEIVGRIDVGLGEFDLVVTRDGALGLPPIPTLGSHEKAVAFFNHLLASSLVGGIYCEAVSSDGLDLGYVIDHKYLRSHQPGQSLSNTFHHHARQRQAAPLEAIQLHNPRTMKLAELREALRIGISVLQQLRSVRGEFLLRGTTALARRDWTAAVSNLWIVIEQIITDLWDHRVVVPSTQIDKSKKRREQLLDNRTWTMSAKIEVLHQKGILDLTTLQTLNAARKARNDLAHRGDPSKRDDAMSAYDGVRLLVRVALPTTQVPLFDLDLSDHALSDPFAPRVLRQIEPQFWMAIPKLPGEEEIERTESKRFRAEMKEN